MAAFNHFCAENNRDELQCKWVVAHFETIEQRGMWELNAGAMPSYLDWRWFLLASLLTLGWLYETWYLSLTTVVELPLRKTLTLAHPASDDSGGPTSGADEPSRRFTVEIETL